MQSRTRAMRREQIERLLASGMSVDEWCRLNKVGFRVIYKWLRIFRDEEPELFGGHEIAHAGDGKRFWFEEIRAAMGRSTALARAGGGSVAPAAPSFALVDTSDALGAVRLAKKDRPPRPAGPCIVVDFRGAKVTVPPGAAEADTRSVLKAVLGA